MTIDHIGLFIGVYNPGIDVLWLRIIGRLAAPLYIFLLAEGVRHTRNIYKYLLRIGLMALSVILIMLIINVLAPNSGLYGVRNIFLEFFFLILTIVFLKLQPKILKLLALLPIGAIITGYLLPKFALVPLQYSFLLPEYDVFALVLFLGFYFSSTIIRLVYQKYNLTTSETLETNPQYLFIKNLFSVAVIILTTFIFYLCAELGFIYEYGGIQSFFIFSFIFIIFYNYRLGYRGKITKWIKYTYYPVHLLILFLAFSLIFM
jgi:hypothetical protein